MSERRSTNRVRTYVGGRIAFGEDLPAVSCLVRDVSATGAKLVVCGANTLPKNFQLVIPRMSMSINVKLVWSKGDLCGVRFVPGAGAALPSWPEPAARAMPRKTGQLTLETDL
jgi:PilZ domain